MGGAEAGGGGWVLGQHWPLVALRSTPAFVVISHFGAASRRQSVIYSKRVADVLWTEPLINCPSATHTVEEREALNTKSSVKRNDGRFV